jgi:hypothetical protein
MSSSTLIDTVLSIDQPRRAPIWVIRLNFRPKVLELERFGRLSNRIIFILVAQFFETGYDPAGGNCHYVLPPPQKSYADITY